MVNVSERKGGEGFPRVELVYCRVIFVVFSSLVMKDHP